MLVKTLLSSLPAYFVDPIKKQIVCSGISMASDCVETHWIAVLTSGLILWAQSSNCALSTVSWNQYAFKIEIFEASSIYLFFATDNNTVNIKGQHTPALSNMRQNARPHYFLCANTHWQQLDTPGCISRMASKIFIVVVVGYIVRVICCFQNNTGYSDYQPDLVCQIINKTNAIGSSPWWYHLCCSWTVLTFFFWWLATSGGTLLSPSRLEWETKALVIIKRRAKLDSVGVCWP